MNPKRLDVGNRFTTPLGKNARNKITVGQNLPNILGKPQLAGELGRTRSYGPAVLGLARDPAFMGGPGSPPAGFIGGTNSLSEWFLYWALEKLLGPEGLNWQYQSAWLGGRQERGGAVVDFVVRQASGRRVGVRVQTYRFHFNVNATEQASDVEQLLALSSPDFIVIDVFEDQYIHDETGQAAIRTALEIINERQRPNPLATGYVVGTG